MNNMAKTIDEYQGLWRLSAKESVLYNDDFPEPLLVLPELWDGAIGQGHATVIKTTFRKSNTDLWDGSVEDNGEGIRNERRLKSWAASKSVDNIHRNGHGSKKALTKFMPDYESANWEVKWRGKRNPNLQVLKGPFRAWTEDEIIEDEIDKSTLIPSGTCWSWKFDPCVLKLNTADGCSRTTRNFKDLSTLMTALREIVRSRYSEDRLKHVDFQFELVDGDKIISESSRTNNWHSLHTQVELAIKTGDVEKVLHRTQEVEGGIRTFDLYRIVGNGKKSYELKKEFPFYGQKSMRSSRIHVSLDGRMIEAIPIHKILGRETSHGDDNGYIGFVNYKPTRPEDYEKMPQPAATKVSFWTGDPRYDELLTSLRTIISENPRAVHITDAEDKSGATPAVATSSAVEPRKKKSTVTPAMRETIWKKYIGNLAECPCPVCQDRKISMTDYSAGHIIAEACGGTTDINNLVPICGNCNSRIGIQNLYEYTQKNHLRGPLFPGVATVSNTVVLMPAMPETVTAPPVKTAKKSIKSHKEPSPMDVYLEHIKSKLNKSQFIKYTERLKQLNTEYSI